MSPIDWITVGALPAFVLGFWAGLRYVRYLVLKGLPKTFEDLAKGAAWYGHNAPPESPPIQ